MSSGLLTLLDDIAMLADDVSVAAKKTVGILGDDLAVNAEKATGFDKSRELKVLYSIAKGATINKLILLPTILTLNIVFPSILKYILIIGGLYLLFEAGEKIYEFLYDIKDENHKEELHNSTPSNIMEIEKQKIKSAIVTDFILSIEIIILALSTLSDKSILSQILGTTIVGLGSVIFVYGLVALIIRMDDMGLYLHSKGYKKTGKIMIKSMGVTIHSLSIIGTIAMILVGSSILVHNVENLNQLPLSESLIFQFVFGSVLGYILFLFLLIKEKIF